MTRPARPAGPAVRRALIAAVVAAEWAAALTFIATRPAAADVPAVHVVRSHEVTYGGEISCVAVLSDGLLIGGTHRADGKAGC